MNMITTLSKSPLVNKIKQSPFCHNNFEIKIAAILTAANTTTLALRLATSFDR